MAESPSEIVGRNVRRVRKALGARQADVARRAGLSPAALSRLESGERGASVEDLLALALVLHVAPVWLLCPWRDDEPDLAVRVGGNVGWALDPLTAQLWLLGELPFLPSDLGTYYFTVPPDQKGRTSRTLAWLEEEGIASSTSDGTVFHFDAGDVFQPNPMNEEE